MLVLRRKKGERVMIGPNIEVVVLETRGSKVQLSIVAPLEVTVHRKEVYDRIRQDRLRESVTWQVSDEQSTVRPCWLSPVNPK